MKAILLSLTILAKLLNASLFNSKMTSLFRMALIYEYHKCLSIITVCLDDRTIWLKIVPL